jgi:hypothetical protein
LMTSVTRFIFRGEARGVAFTVMLKSETLAIGIPEICLFGSIG